MWGLLAGLGLGALKNIEGNSQAEAQRKQAAAIQRYSPWTGMQAAAPKDPSLIGDLATGGAIGTMGEKMFMPGAAPQAGEFAPSGETGILGDTAAVSGPQNPTNFSFENSGAQGGYGGPINSWMKMLNGGPRLPTLYSK